MTEQTFYFVVAILIGAIALVSILLMFSGRRFKRTKYKDEFRTKSQVGKQNVGTMRKKKTYREVVKDKNLSEGNKLSKKMNPRVTRSMTKVTRDVRSKD